MIQYSSRCAHKNIYPSLHCHLLLEKKHQNIHVHAQQILQHVHNATCTQHNMSETNLKQLNCCKCITEASMHMPQKRVMPKIIHIMHIVAALSCTTRFINWSTNKIVDIRSQIQDEQFITTYITMHLWLIAGSSIDTVNLHSKWRKHLKLLTHLMDRRQKYVNIHVCSNVRHQRCNK